MLDELKERVTSMLARVELGPEAPPEPAVSSRRRLTMMSYNDPAGERALCRRRRAGGRAPEARRSTRRTRATWKRDTAKRAVPVRVGEEIQALPRQGGIGFDLASIRGHGDRGSDDRHW